MCYTRQHCVIVAATCAVCSVDVYNCLEAAVSIDNKVWKMSESHLASSCQNSKSEDQYIVVFGL